DGLPPGQHRRAHGPQDHLGPGEGTGRRRRRGGGDAEPAVPRAVELAEVVSPSEDAMACLLIPLIVAGLAFANAATVRLLQRRHAGRGWWAALFVAWLAGAVLGGWGCFFEYQLSPRLRVVGAPVPEVFFLLEGPPGEEQWADYVTPAAPLLAA